ncbi:hypothetical protein KSS87_016712 [Heliosperma pusillum]|nr:hypothetical protein KSS87_016712 [Heliosperma pusillum]
MKLAFVIYLWYPKTKGTSYVYESILRPLVSRHETDIDKHLQELRLRAWDLAIYYYQNCTDLGQSAFFNVIQYIANQSTRLKGGSIQNQGQQGSPPPPSRAPGISPLRQRKPNPESPTASPQQSNRRWPPPVVEQAAPSAPPMPTTFPTLFKEQAHPSKSKVVQVEVNELHTEYVHVDQLYQHEKATKEKRHSSSRFNLFRSNNT